MIKITSFYEKRCSVLFKLEPTRPHRIFEPKLAEAIAKGSTDYKITKRGEIYGAVSGIGLEHSIGRLKEMQENAQEKFSERIQKLSKKVDEFKLLQELTKKKPVKKGE